MATERGFDRLVNFSDAVVAIAITILILPMVNEASAVSAQGIDGLVKGILPQLFMFVLSFVIIAYFWLQHHRFFERLRKIDHRLMLINLAWLMGIVFMPFPTVLVVEEQGPDGWANGLYIGTMLYISVVQLLMKLQLRKHPELMTDSDSDNLFIPITVVISATLMFSLVLALAIPAVGLWSLFLMWLSPVAAKFIPKH